MRTILHRPHRPHRPDAGRRGLTPTPDAMTATRTARPRMRQLMIAAVAALAALAATAGSTLGAPVARAASSQTVSVNFASTTVTVNLAQTGAAPTHVGAGYLYGLSQDGSGPSDSWLQPLSPTLFRGGGARLSGDGWIGDGYTDGPGFQARIASAVDQAERVTAAPYKATYDLLVSDLYGADTTQASNTVYPCDNGDCSNFVTFITDVVDAVQAAGVDVDYDIWNEPDGTGFWQRGVNSSQYFQMWNTAVQTIRAIDPSAVILGPSYSGYNHDWLEQFLSTTSADGTLPNVLNWHFSSDPVTDSEDAASIVSSLGLAPIPQQINEYLDSDQQTAGYTAWYLSRLAASGVSAAAHAIWSDCCVAGTLDDTIAGTGELAAPTGQWWVYRAYGAMSGQTVSTSSANSAIAAVAAADQSTDQADILIGNNSDQTGTTTIDVDGLGSDPWLTDGSTVHATLYRIPDQTPLDNPLVVSDSQVTISNGGISVPATFETGTDAFWLVLSPGGVAAPTDPSSTGGTQVVVDGNDTGTGNDEFQYGTNWGLTTGVSDMYAGTANWSQAADATATLTFTGVQASLAMVRDVDQGIFTVSVDGGTPTTVDDYAPTRDASGIVWTSPVLSSGTHTLTIVNTGTHDASSSGTSVTIDRAFVTPDNQIVVDGNTTGTGNDEFQYGANWGLTTGVADMFDGTADWSNTSGATATFTFTGTQVALHAVQDVDQGIMTVSVDGGTPATVDDYAPIRNAAGVVWTSPVLAAGTHTLAIVNTGQKDTASSGVNIAIDRADVVPSSSNQIIVDGNATGTGNDEFQYDANWGLTTGVTDMYDQTANWSHVAGATAVFRFTGTQVALHAVRDVDQGIFTVSVDGGAAQSIDDYASTRDASGIVWTSPVLAEGSHTLTIVNTGQKDADSSGINIAIDRADVTT